MNGEGSIGHNTRRFIADNVDASRTKNNITLIHEDIKQAYHKLFDKALKEYNAKQKRKDRQIKSYYDKISRSKQEKLFYEVIVQIGNRDDTGVGSSSAEVATWVLKDYVKKFQLRNPQLYVIGAYIHLDEETPHLHLNFIPWVSGCKRGLETKTSLKAALATRGFVSEGKGNTEWRQWAEAEKEDIALIMSRYGIDWKKKDTHNKHLSVLDYKKQERTKEVAALEEEIEGAQVVLELKEERIESLEKEIESKRDSFRKEQSEAQKKLDDTIAENQKLQSETTDLRLKNSELRLEYYENADMFEGGGSGHGGHKGNNWVTMPLKYSIMKELHTEREISLLQPIAAVELFAFVSIYQKELINLLDMNSIFSLRHHHKNNELCYKNKNKSITKYFAVESAQIDKDLIEKTGMFFDIKPYKSIASFTSSEEWLVLNSKYRYFIRTDYKACFDSIYK